MTGALEPFYETIPFEWQIVVDMNQSSNQEDMLHNPYMDFPKRELALSAHHY